MNEPERTGENSACRLNDAIPKIGEVVHRNLLDAISERERLLNCPKPKYGWSTGIGNLISQRVTALNEMITNITIEERKAKDERKRTNTKL